MNVATVLEGSVRRHGERVRITVQLIETATDSHLWSETYDREMKDVFAIQDDIAQSIVDALQMTLTPRDRRALQYVATTNPEAYDAGCEEPMVLYNVVCTYALPGEAERAMELLEKTVDLGWGDRAWLETDSVLDSFRDIPRFKFLLKRIY